MPSARPTATADPVQVARARALTSATLASATASRLVSLDVFRGATMAAMVIVNNPGDWGAVYAPLLHAPWHGWTPTDLIFPFFLFIVGVSLTMSRKTDGRWMPVLRRGAILCALGLFLAGFPTFVVSRWRIPGVLQRIGVCYVAAVALYRWTRPHPSSSSLRHASRLGAAAAALLVAYWALMTRVPPPGGTAGDLTPEGNLGAAIDRALMLGHLWKPQWDPEGLLSTIPAIGTTLFGVVAGLWLRADYPRPRLALGLAAGGAAAIAIGLVWGWTFPINKSLWTSSYAIFTAGAAAVALAGCYALVDVAGSRWWSPPWIVLGSNAIALFVLSGLIAKTLSLIPAGGSTLKGYLYRTLFVPIAAPKNASLLFAVANLAALYGILLWLYRRRIFIKV